MFSSVSGIHHRGGDPYEIGSDTSIPNFIVDPTPLFLRENKPRRFLEPCYCIMGRLVSQERNRILSHRFLTLPTELTSFTLYETGVLIASQAVDKQPHLFYNVRHNLTL